MEFIDRLLTCVECGGEFVFTAGEQLFFFDKQYKYDPKRCKSCKSRANLGRRSDMERAAAATSSDQSHSAPVRIEFGKQSWAYYAVRARRRALVFLHGFRGESIGTWSQFERLIFTNPAFREFDCFFVGYDGIYASLVSSSKRFYQFLDDLLGPTPSSRSRLCVPDDRELPYSEVIVVAHSMGSVVVRMSLLEADEDSQPWASNVSIVLYAPAHFGARVLPYISTVLDNTFLRAVVPLVKYKCHPIDELKPGSPFLTSLAVKVNATLNADPSKAFLIARRVIHAHNDNVVEGRHLRFCNDPKAEWIDGNHESISKPQCNDSESMQQLLAALRK
jgi:pimeloyl-ACP methyl ester carboxylesterase